MLFAIEFEVCIWNKQIKKKDRKIEEYYLRKIM